LDTHSKHFPRRAGHARKGYSEGPTVEPEIPWSPVYLRADWRTALAKKRGEPVPFVDGGDEEPEQPAPEGQALQGSYRKVTFDFPPDLHFIYLTVKGTAERNGLNFQIPFGNWVRDTVMQYYIAHPELADLAQYISPREKAQLLGVESDGREEEGGQPP